MLLHLSVIKNIKINVIKIVNQIHFRLNLSYKLQKFILYESLL